MQRSAGDILAVGETLTADAFALAILTVEGWPEPEQDYEWRPALRRLFVERYGEAISASDYAARFS